MSSESKQANRVANHEEVFQPFQLGILVFSVYILIALLVDVIFPLGESTRQLLAWIDFGVCMVFLGFFVQVLESST